MYLNIQDRFFEDRSWFCFSNEFVLKDVSTILRIDFLKCNSLELFINGQNCSFGDLSLLFFWFRYWSPIDEMLREAAVLREVKVRLLIGLWKRTHPLTFNFMTSMQALCTGLPVCSIEVVRKQSTLLICWYTCTHTQTYI